MLVFCALGIFFFRVRCAESRETLTNNNILGHEIRNERDLSLVMVDACRLDVDALCKMPSTFGGLYGTNQIQPNGQPRFFSILLIQEEPLCNQNLFVPNPFTSLIYPFLHRSCVRDDLQVHEPSNPQELLEDIMDLAVEQMSNDHYLATNPQGSARYQFSLKGLPSLRSRFVSNKNVRSRAMMLFLLSLVETLVNPASLSGSLVFLPEQLTIPQYTRDECLASFESSVRLFRQRRQSEKELADTLIHIAQKVKSRSNNATSIKSLRRIPEFPFTTAGLEKSQCIHHLYKNDFLLSQTCRNHLDLTFKKLDELEFSLDTPIAFMVLCCYIIYTLFVLSDLQTRLGNGETKAQRGRRYFIQTLQDPVLRKGIETDAIRDRGQEAAAVMMERLDAKAARFMHEAQADDDWKQQELRINAWKKRLGRLAWYRFGFTAMCFLSCLLLFIDQPKAGRILDGLLVVASGFLATYFCMPQSPLQGGKKMLLEEPLLSGRT